MSVQLRSSKIYWDPDDKIMGSILSNNGRVELEQLSASDLTHLVRELDRRLIQYADKCKYERDNSLVDYSKVKP